MEKMTSNQFGMVVKQGRYNVKILGISNSYFWML